MSQNQFPSVALLITAAIYAGFALWLGLMPDNLLTAFGIEQSTAAMRTEIRAFYGGIELGIATAMIFLWTQDQSFAGLVIGGLPLAGSASGRLIGMTIDGFDATHLLLAGVEFGGCIFCLLAAASVSRGAKSSSSQSTENAPL